MNTEEIVISFITAGITYYASILLINYFIKNKKTIRIVIGTILFISSLYIGFDLKAMHNNLYVLVGLQWGLFGGALYVFSHEILKRKKQ